MCDGFDARPLAHFNGSALPFESGVVRIILLETTSWAGDYSFVPSNYTVVLTGQPTLTHGPNLFYVRDNITFQVVLENICILVIAEDAFVRSFDVAQSAFIFGEVFLTFDILRIDLASFYNLVEPQNNFSVHNLTIYDSIGTLTTMENGWRLEGSDVSVLLLNNRSLRQPLIKLRPNQTSVELNLFRSNHRPSSLTLDLHSISSATFSVTLNGLWKANTFAKGNKFTILKFPNLTIIPPSNLPSDPLWWNVETDAEANETKQTYFIFIIIFAPLSVCIIIVVLIVAIVFLQKRTALREIEYIHELIHGETDILNFDVRE
jgi:hypothetical protein